MIRAMTPEAPDAGVARNTVVMGGAAVLLAGAVGLGLAGAQGMFTGERPRPATGAAGAEGKNCEGAEFGHPAADSIKYNEFAFFPKPATVNPNDEEKTKYLNSLFANQPLGGNLEKASEAIAMAAIGEPAQDKVAFDPKRSIIDAYDRALAAMNGTNGLEKARQDCAQNRKVIGAASKVVTGWAHQGDTVVIFKAIKDDKNNIVRVKEENFAVKGELSGIQISKDNAPNVPEIDGFGDVLIATNPGNAGQMFMKGKIVEERTSTEQTNAQAVTPSPSPAPLSGASTEQGGATGGTNGTSGPKGVTNGTNPERLSGPAGGTRTGSGAVPEAAPSGKDNTPAGGGAGPAPGPGAGPAPATSPKPEKSTPPANQPPSQPSQQPTPSPTNTAPKDPTTCDPNIAKC